METTASDLSARLLATENLSVIRARTQTASFDIKSRVLTLPMWKDMTPEIEDMLIGHEVGHALYTGEEYLVPIQDNMKMMSYLNIIEDVRIEKLMKRRYPGLRKRMNEGYKQLNDRDFFGVKQIQSFDDLLLIDKINLYFKAGFQCGVTFTPDEKQFVNRAERVETIDEVIALANDIYAYSKEQMEERKKRVQDASADEETEEDDDDQDEFGDDLFDDDFDGGEEQEDQQQGNGGKQHKQKSGKGKSSANNNKTTNQDVSDEELESKTERVFSKKLEDLADTNTQYVYWKFDKNYFKDPVIGYKRILNETMSPESWYTSGEFDRYTRYMDDAQRADFAKKQLGEYAKFKTESSSTVNYLVKEFEMKKSAQTYKRAQVSKIGSLDMAKVYSYKLKDDLFKRVTMLPQGKNHGMVMLVDWSGSMNDVLHDTLKQVINLAMFCNRTQIPYRVFAFTNGYNDQWTSTEELYQKYNAWMRGKADDLLSTATSRFNLLELFSSKMTTSEFNSMCKRVLHYSFFANDNYSTSSTPLNEALVWCYQHIGTYMKNNNVEKMTFITLTDGDGHSLQGVNKRMTDWEYEPNSHKRLKVKNFIKDEVTQKTYELDAQGAPQSEMILRMIKDRYGIAVVGFHICGSGRRELETVIGCNLPSFAGDRYSLVESWRTAFRKDGFVSVKNTGRDELFLITKQSTKIEEGELETNADMNAKAIAKNFGKYLNVKKTSRVLLNRFVTLVA